MEPTAAYGRGQVRTFEPERPEIHGQFAGQVQDLRLLAEVSISASGQGELWPLAKPQTHRYVVAMCVLYSKSAAKNSNHGAIEPSTAINAVSNIGVQVYKPTSNNILSAWPLHTSVPFNGILSSLSHS